MEALYNWLFHYNNHTGIWNCYNREDHFAYWNGTTPKHPILKSKDIAVIQEILVKTSGDKAEIEKVTNERT